MSKISVEIGQRIRGYRLQQGLSQEELAEKCGLHPTYIGQVERGEKNATLESISKIAGGLSISLSTLFENIGTDDGHESLPNSILGLALTLSPSNQKNLFEIIKNILKMK